MARMLRPLAMSALLALLSCSGCSSWRQRQQAAGGYTSNSSSPGDGGIIQDLSDASINDWNFRRFW
jgi:hypothetical protein